MVPRLKMLKRPRAAPGGHARHQAAIRRRTRLQDANARPKRAQVGLLAVCLLSVHTSSYAQGPKPTATTPSAATQPHVLGQQAKAVYTGNAMGTVIQLTFWTDDEAAAAKAAEAVFAEMKRIDRVMTTWLPESEVSQINSNAGIRAVAVSDETFTVIAKAQDIAKRTNGIFDITVGAFRGLWKFDEDMDGSLPAAAEIAKRKKLVNYRDVVLDAKHKTVKLRRANMSITLGGIAKGYAVDKCVALLHQLGFVDFIVQAGGDLYVSGQKFDQPWVLGVRDPRGARDNSFATVALRDRAFSTSGDYERAFVKDGQRYHHILDPRTAAPAMRTRSVTVLAPDAFTADAWSKVFFIEGWQKALKRADALPDVGIVVVDEKNQVHISKRLANVVTILHPPTPGI